MSRLHLLFPFALLACSQQSADQPATVRAPYITPVSAAQAPAGFPETFEAGSKGAYAEADETLGSGSWHFTEALIGTSEQDHKRGEHAARLRERGRLRMNFDAPRGVRSIRVSSASYGDDAPSTWELWASSDGGRRYVRLGQSVRTSARLVATTFPAPTAGALRLEIRKTDKGKGRLNIDDIVLDASGSVAPSPAPRPSASLPSLPPATTRQATAVVTSRDDNMALGNPSGATSDPANATNYLLVHPQFTIGYNANRGTPTWVSWHLNRAWRGSAPRQDDFRPDLALPRGFYQVTPRSYSGSGFDKGHNCPSADRTTDLDDNSATFLMTNMIPQAPNNNQRTWSALEEYGRSLVDRGNEIYIIMGSYGKGGTGANGLATTLDNGHVTVPKRVWKVLVVLPEGGNDLQRIAAGQARLIAIDTPNDNGVSPNWGQYRVSVDAIEAATGLDLLSKLPLEVQTRLQASIDSGPTQ
ncbi:DNA/RNA non-specific endonuclease [Hymenobacter sp. GOD-10R]|uniref:DNA/RNA non-specific endonuclease n=1 Tax=Hymenobacter sp. GOD-10R TaxID=3093922 RepID=UPI002D793C11|nr:DNA/RNA non-specific endonuclease [Hymenobacter sp. GOD-10R]WRQ26500.1 DNA/RNA non-specific endonuclease [Hymenobacter sp. GOD-10R]